MSDHKKIKAIIGLGNPGSKFAHTRHNAGFMVVDALAEQQGAQWKEKDNFEVADITLNNDNILLIKPLTFMNSSGRVLGVLAKKGIKPEEILVVHDEIELPFGKVKYKFSGSHKGHNGLRSIIEVIGKDFGRLRLGVGRPDDAEHVPDYVLSNFSEPRDHVDRMIDEGVEHIYSQSNETASK